VLYQCLKLVFWIRIRLDVELFGQAGDVSGIIIIVNFYFKVDEFVSDYISYLLI
jgi:hypothetical protein